MEHDFEVVAIGEVNVDLLMIGVRDIPRWGTEVLCDTMALRLGGSTANFACAAAALGLRTALVSWIGEDDFGQFLVSQLQAARVHTSFVFRTREASTGLTVALSGPHDRAFVTALGTIDRLRAADVPAAAFRARHIHVGSYFLQSALQPDLPELLRRAKRAGCTCSLDAGYDPAERWSEAILDAIRAADLFFPNETEACSIARRSDPVEAGKWLAEKTGALIVVKLGDAGSCAFGSAACARQPAFKVDVVDTTACGDAFNAGFLAAWLDGKPLDECLRWGNACGALMATVAGNGFEVLSRQRVEEMLSISR